MPLEQTSDENVSAQISLLRRRLSGFETEVGRLKGLSYRPRANDVVITTSPKAGTTWMQQICHQIRSADKGGHMNFAEISEVVPWLELAHDQGQDLEAPQYGETEGKPRLFKTHAWATHCPSFPKTIVLLRNPGDVLVSFYRFFEGWFFEPGSVKLEEFAREFWLARGVPENRMQNASYFVHLVSWYEKRHDDGVLFVFFEDMLDDLEREVRRVARFLSTDQHRFDTDPIVSHVTRLSTFEFMKEHEFQFDEKLSKLARNTPCGLPATAGMSGSKLIDGKAGLADALLSEESKKEILRKWRSIVEPVTNCASYDEFRIKMGRAHALR